MGNLKQMMMGDLIENTGFFPLWVNVYVCAYLLTKSEVITTAIACDVTPFFFLTSDCVGFRFKIPSENVFERRFL